jgi:DNA-binding response OmpR family regulator
MSSADKPKILVIDDSEICLELVADALELSGFAVETSSKSLGTGKLIAELMPDVVVVDIGMPALDGATLVQIIRRNRVCECAVLLHTDRDRAELDATVASSGADGGAIKSADSRELIREIRRVLALRRGR